ncbi:MAG: RNA 3'-terminal phosphate cyclase [Candidatus Sumerlaeota bacterium]|nr:RNA 3'-terminal phosphate cyclase [Candidatus Sumerlaeota bacterium]
MIEIDGSQGEGGGQILRTSLALALVTGTPFRIYNIRARREKPGLRRQHLTAVQAAAQIGGAAMRGAEIGSQDLRFEPGAIRSGHYRFSIGTAGSCTLVLQTILPPLLIQGEGASEIILEGGTHNPMAPPFDFLAKTFLPLLHRMGAHVSLRLERHGFYPAGGGLLRVSIQPTQRLEPLNILERGPIKRRRIRALVSRLPESIGEREVKTIQQRLEWPSDCCAVEAIRNAHGPGNAVMIEIESEALTEVFTGFGEKGVPAERVAAQVAEEAEEYLNSGAPVGPHLADQLLIPLALAGSGKFRTLKPTLHTLTNIEAIQRFLDVRILVSRHEEKIHEIEVQTSLKETLMIK